MEIPEEILYEMLKVSIIIGQNHPTDNAAALLNSFLVGLKNSNTKELLKGLENG